MKRPNEEHFLNEEAICLPDDVIVEILLYAFPRLQADIGDVRSAFRARRTSPRMRDLIDTHLIGSLKQVSFPVSAQLNDKNVLFFHGLRELKVRVSSTISKGVLSQMTGLESLRLDSRRIGDDTIQALTNLRKLKLICYDSIHGQYIGRSGPYEVTHRSLSKLTRLEVLKVRHRERITDKDIACVQTLKYLQVLDVNNGQINGDCFASLTNLERLSLIHCSNVKEDSLKSLTQLKSLHLAGDNVLLRNRSFSTLKNITYFGLEHNQRLSSSALQSFVDTLEEIKLDSITNIELEILTTCPKLKVVNLDYNYYCNHGSTYLKRVREILQDEKGVKFNMFCYAGDYK